jgi:hypothetical protein
MTFSYILAGWEGSAHDGKVFNDALIHDFPIFENHFWLADCGYPLRNYCLTPYRGTRYHLKDFKSAGDRGRPQNKEELFNLRHSSARNVVERTQMMKKRTRNTLQ